MSLLWVSRFRDLQATDRLYSTIHYITLVTSLLLFKLVFGYVSTHNSDRLFKKFFFFAIINKSFSSRHKLHRFDPALYAATCFIMDHLMWWSRFPIFKIINTSRFMNTFINRVTFKYNIYRRFKYNERFKL